MRRSTPRVHPFEYWSQVPGWCALCRETYNVRMWTHHCQQRDHNCLEMVFDALANGSYPWSYNAVLSTLKPRLDGIDLTTCLRGLDDSDAIRRQELYCLLRSLVNTGVLRLGSQLESSPLATNVMLDGVHFVGCHLQPFLELFPRASHVQWGNFMGMVSSNYSCGTLFDMIQMDTLLPVHDRCHVYHHTAKATIVRNIFGQLRWAAEGQKPPWGVGHSEAPVAEVAVIRLLTELVWCRIAEYVYRVEPVWRAYKAPNSGSSPCPPTPPLIGSGVSSITSRSTTSGGALSRASKNTWTSQQKL